MEYHNPLEGRIKFVLDNLEVAHAVYENLGYIQGYIESAKVHSPKISEEYLREMEREKYRNVGINEPQEVPGWVKDCLESMEQISVEEGELEKAERMATMENDAEIIVSDEVKECIQKGNWLRYKESVSKYNCSCCSAEITGPIILILTPQKIPLCERCFERLQEQISVRDYWIEREREHAESMEVKENEIDENA